MWEMANSFFYAQPVALAAWCWGTRIPVATFRTRTYSSTPVSRAKVQPTCACPLHGLRPWIRASTAKALQICSWSGTPTSAGACALKCRAAGKTPIMSPQGQRRRGNKASLLPELSNLLGRKEALSRAESQRAGRLPNDFAMVLHGHGKRESGCVAPCAWLGRNVIACGPLSLRHGRKANAGAVRCPQLGKSNCVCGLDCVQLGNKGFQCGGGLSAVIAKAYTSVRWCTPFGKKGAARLQVCRWPPRWSLQQTLVTTPQSSGSWFSLAPQQGMAGLFSFALGRGLSLAQQSLFPFGGST